MDVDTSIEIGFYELYVIYVRMVLQMKKVLYDKKQVEMQYNTEPGNIMKEIACLYYHYGSLTTVTSMLTQRYDLSPKYKEPQNIITEFINMLKINYRRLGLGGIFGHIQFEMAVNREYNNTSRTWEKIKEKLIQNEIAGNISQEEKDKLNHLIKKAEREGKQKGEESDHTSLENGKEKLENVIALDSEEESCHGWSREERKYRVIRETKVPKIEL